MKLVAILKVEAGSSGHTGPTTRKARTYTQRFEMGL